MTSYILSLADPQADLAAVGGKGASLAKLARGGLPVPGGFHVTTTAYREFVAANRLQMHIDEALKQIDPAVPSTLETASAAIRQQFTAAEIPAGLRQAILQAYAALPGDNPAVAVRSSATAEDLPEASFAGQQETYLNQRGGETVLATVRQCWASLWTARAIAYRLRQGIAPEEVALAVVVQFMVQAEASGILFTANPLNGKRSEVVINAAWGLGEAIVSGAVTPDTAVIEKATGRVLRRQTAEKQVMTIQADVGTQEQPVPDEQRSRPVLSDAQAIGLAQLGVQIEALYQAPMDVEWALLDGQFFILQARPITALPPEPIVWRPPDLKSIYMRGSVVDLMPDPLRPLFITLGMPALRQQMQVMGDRLFGSMPILGDEYYTTINSYAYMNAKFPPRAWLWIIFRMIPAYPRLLRQLVPIWRDEMHPQYQAYAESLKAKNPTEMNSAELWKAAQEAVNATMYYVVTLLFATMGASAGGEMLLTRVYEKLAKKEGDPPATVLLMGWNNIPARAEKSLYDLSVWCREHPDVANVISKGDARQVADLLKRKTATAGVDPQDWQEMRQRFEQHLELFGHIIFQLDFAEDLPLDHPETMLGTIKMYLEGKGVNPHERQKAAEARRIQTAEKVLGQLKGLRRWAFNTALKAGQSMAEVREDALADIGLAYPALRRMLHELGSRFTAAGILEKAEDIYWLEKAEIDALVARGDSPLAGRVAERKAAWKRLKSETPPPMLPPKKRYMGIKMDDFVAQSSDSQTSGSLKGVAASPGKVTAMARVLHGPEDFDKMQPGEVLVAGATTPAWTPLFAMACAVVTDIGGPLSHGSIIAREYGIPAVMGTGVATRRIRDGQMITVDGDAGKVILVTSGG
jgi:pyruvate,water dikinase